MSGRMTESELSRHVQQLTANGSSEAAFWAGEAARARRSENEKDAKLAAQEATIKALAATIKALADALMMDGIFGPGGKWHVIGCSGACSRVCEQRRAALRLAGRLP